MTTYMEGISVNLPLAVSRPSQIHFSKKLKDDNLVNICLIIKKRGNGLFNHHKVTKKGTLIRSVQVISKKMEGGSDDSERELDCAL